MGVVCVAQTAAADRLQFVFGLKGVCRFIHNLYNVYKILKIKMDLKNYFKDEEETL